MNLIPESDVKIAVTIAMNLLMIIYCVSVDLGEQLTFIDELEESYNAEIKGSSWISTSIFFVIEARQYAVVHNHGHHHHSNHHEN